jgi:CDP-glucose 4,6-dehydratase
MGLDQLFGGQYSGKRVFLTGHTGFKGSWMAKWLTLMGADVYGYSLPAPTTPSHWEALSLDIDSTIGDVADYDALHKALHAAQPDIIFHLAAQPLVIPSYKDPMETMYSNVVGTLNICEAARHVNSVQAICIVTTDKCYLNINTPTPYLESASLGGRDPYSASKACAEIVSASYRHSFLNESGIHLATCRGGNVVGGGDWGEYRLLPDIIQTAVTDSELTLRHPDAVRPWQHVLDCLSGYLIIGQKLLEKNPDAADAWNIGPQKKSTKTVSDVIDHIQSLWKPLNVTTDPAPQHHEEHYLTLDSTKIHDTFGWQPVWEFETSVAKTVSWAKAYYDNKTLMTDQQIHDYVQDAKTCGAVWAL